VFTCDQPPRSASVAVVADTDPNNIDVHDVPDTTRASSPEVDLDAIERDLAGVERALERLSDGTYWTDEVTGEPIADHVLADDPTTRRA
jgi:RNA polymerase-binding transcription factor DksA